MKSIKKRKKKAEAKKKKITANNLFDYSKPIDISGRRNMKIIWPKEYEEFYISPDEYDDDDLQDNEEEPQDDDRRTGLFAKIFGRLRGERKETRNR